MTKTREEALAKAGRILAVARVTAAAMTPAELARAAWHPSCGKTREELEDEIRADRGLPPLAAAS